MKKKFEVVVLAKHFLKSYMNIFFFFMRKKKTLEVLSDQVEFHGSEYNPSVGYKEIFE